MYRTQSNMDESAVVFLPLWVKKV